jgi:hypothetical protein
MYEGLVLYVERIKAKLVFRKGQRGAERVDE